MSDLLTDLTQLAVSAFRHKIELLNAQPMIAAAFYPDPVLAAARATCDVNMDKLPETNAVVSRIFCEPDFLAISPRNGELDPMLLHPGGGIRVPARQIITSLFSSAFLLIYFLRLPHDESTYVRTVLEGFEELRKAIRGEPIRLYDVWGIAQITVPEGRHVNTPWGILRRSPVADGQISYFSLGRPPATCVLVQTSLVPVIFDRHSQPAHKFDDSFLKRDIRAQFLFPLSCALASIDAKHPIAAIHTWGTTLLSFQNLNGYSYTLQSPTFQPQQDLSDRIIEIEEWARIIERSHIPELDVAATRLVSAITRREDRADALIDAVMVWENLLGTAQEVTFRVSAALAKLVERDPMRRISLKKELSRVYGIRSRLVHGERVEGKEVQDASETAVGTAVQALRESYRKGKDWLDMSSQQRSDTILLEWP